MQPVAGGPKIHYENISYLFYPYSFPQTAAANTLKQMKINKFHYSNTILIVSLPSFIRISNSPTERPIHKIHLSYASQVDDRLPFLTAQYILSTFLT
jgi:hypothetical protein